MLHPDVGDPYHMDDVLYENLSMAKDINKKDWDFVFIIDGQERAGKSCLAQQCAFFLDESLGIDQITFSHEQFELAVKTAPHNSAVVWDEAFGGLNARQTMSLINRTIVRMLTEIGFKNLFIFIVLPSYFDLDRYVALWRSTALLHVYTMGTTKERGFFKAYNYETKKNLYVMGKKFYNYGAVKYNFHGRFTKRWIVDKALYDEKKRKAAESITKKDERAEADWKAEFIKRVAELDDIPHKYRAQMLGISERAWFYKVKANKSDVADVLNDIL